MGELLRMIFLFWLPPKVPDRRMSIRIADLENIEPGKILSLGDPATGHRWCIMHYEDFEHVIDTGNRFRIIDPPLTDQTSGKSS